MALHRMDTRNVRVVHGGQHPSFPSETAHRLRIRGEVRWHELQGGLAVELMVMGAPDVAHRPGAYTVDELVPVQPGSRLQRNDIAHWDVR